MSDTIFIDPENRPPYPPCEPAESDPEYVKHVCCDGARFHVLSWAYHVDAFTGKGATKTHCSEPRCIKNKPKGDEE